jgi:hypothetical protein
MLTVTISICKLNGILKAFIVVNLREANKTVWKGLEGGVDEEAAEGGGD